MLDTPPPQSNQLAALERMRRRLLLPSARRFYHRTRSGLMIPGRYYFITWTTATTSNDIEEYWPALRQWLHRYRPRSTWAYCITREGKAHGVIHMVIRLGPGEDRLDAREVREQWFNLTGAKQIRMEKVGSPEKLASYLSDQRGKRRIAGEMAYQDLLKRWRWSRGWLPTGWTRAFGRWFRQTLDLPPDIRDQLVKEWLQRASHDQLQVDIPPRIPVVITIPFPGQAETA
jgi:hypothetical protein